MQKIKKNVAQLSENKKRMQNCTMSMVLIGKSCIHLFP